MSASEPEAGETDGHFRIPSTIRSEGRHGSPQFSYGCAQLSLGDRQRGHENDGFTMKAARHNDVFSPQHGRGELNSKSGGRAAIRVFQLYGCQQSSPSDGQTDPCRRLDCSQAF